MSEYASHELQKAPRLPPAIAITGLLAGKECLFMYAPLLMSSASTLPMEDRYFTIPDRGKCSIDEATGQLEHKLIQAYERAEEPVTLIGHSFGGFVATDLTMKHPEKISQVICLAGAQEGIHTETPASRFLKVILNNRQGAEDLKHESDFMTAHRRKVATQWPSHVPLHLVAASLDTVLLPPIGLRLELPGNMQPDRRIAMPGLLGLLVTNSLLKRLPGLPSNVESLNALSDANHATIVVSPGVMAYTIRARIAAAKNNISSVAMPFADKPPIPLAA